MTIKEKILVVSILDDITIKYFYGFIFQLSKILTGIFKLPF